MDEQIQNPAKETGQEIMDAQVEPVEPVDTINPKHEFSKTIAIIGIVFWITVNVYGMIMMAITLDLSSLMYVIASADAVVAIVYTTYSIKAKAENMIKLKKFYGFDAESVVDAVLHPHDYES